MGTLNTHPLSKLKCLCTRQACPQLFERHDVIGRHNVIWLVIMTFCLCANNLGINSCVCGNLYLSCIFLSVFSHCTSWKIDWQQTSFVHGEPVLEFYFQNLFVVANQVCSNMWKMGWTWYSCISYGQVSHFIISDYPWNWLSHNY